MCLIISVPNLKEIHPREHWLQVIVLNWCEEEENCEENRTVFKNAYLDRKLLIQFSSSLVCKVMYMGGHKMCKCDKDRSSSYRDMRC